PGQGGGNLFPPSSRPGNRPGDGLIGQRPGGNFNRPQLGDNLGIAHRPNIGSGNTAIGSGNTNIKGPTNINRQKKITSNVTNNNITKYSNTTVNRPSYANTRIGPGYGGSGGGYRGGYGGWGGGYGYGGGRYAAYHRGWVNGFWNSHYLPGGGWGW